MLVDRQLAAKILQATQVEGVKKLTAEGYLARAESPDDLWKSILAEPIGANGQTLEEMLRHYSDYTTLKVANEIAAGSVNEKTKDEIITAIVGPPKKNEGLFKRFRDNARAVIATTMQHTSTTTHRSVQSASYETYRWISVIDSKTTEICRSRHNKVFEYSKGPKPPAHFHCRSTIAPNVSGAEDDEMEDGDEWLARQLAGTVTQMLGVKIGKQTVAELNLNAHTRPITIAKLGNSADIMTRPN